MSEDELNPSIPLKFAGGILLACLGFALMAFATKYGNEIAGRISPWWLASSYFLQTCGELLISPIGLAMITILSPPHLVGMMMGVWFFALAGAAALASLLASTATIPWREPASKALGIYHHAFLQFTWLSLIVAVIAFLLVPYLNRLIGSKILDEVA